MPPVVDDAEDSPDVSYPTFDHGEDLYVLPCRDGSVEFRTHAAGEFINTDVIVNLQDER